jgi:branched-chain amino acid transport system permease protein
MSDLTAAATESQQELPARAERPLDVLAVERRRSALGALAVVAAFLVAFSIYAISDGGFTLYLQRCFDGATQGSLYGATALALVLVFRSTRIINFSQGGLAMFGTYLAWEGHAHLGMGIGIAVALAVIVSALGAGVLERGLIRPFDPENHLAITMVTLGLYLAIGSIVGLIWGFEPKGFPSLFPNSPGDSVSIFGARLQYAEIGTVLLILVAVGAIHLLLSRTRIGLAMRCVADNAASAQLLGIDIGRAVQSSWMLAASAGTLAGCLIAPTTSITPTFMNNVLIYGFAAATLGGLDSIAGSIVGGVLVGLITSLVPGYVPGLSSQFSLAVALAVIIVVLQFKPSGLFGRRYLERV